MMTDLVNLTVADGVATLTLNKPPLNLNSMAMTRAIALALERARADVSVRVLVVTAVGDKAFCAGSDIKEFRRLFDEGTVVEDKLQRENDVFSALDTFPKATVAFLNGLAYGGGLELAVCCDLIVAEDHVKLGLPEILLGAFPGSGGTIRVPRRIGEGRAKQLVYLGEPVTAATALDWGLVNYVVPKGEGAAFTRELALKLAERAVNSIEHSKRSIHDSSYLPDSQTVPRMLDSMREVFAHPNALEGMTAFVEKRPARFNQSSK